MRRSSLCVLALAAAALLAPAAAHAVPKDRPWATINVCDTAKKRNSVGIRAGMPGTGRPQRMYMRFQLQWYDAGAGRYVDIGPPSRWIKVGSARLLKAAQRGFTFGGIEDPPAGHVHRLRGRVEFEWRKVRRVGRRERETVARRARRVTRGGLRGVVGGSPKGRSDAVCVIPAP